MKIVFTLLLLCGITYIYAQDVWVQRDSVNGPPRSSCSGFVLNGEGFIIGGLDQIAFKRKMYSYDIVQDDWDDEVSIGGENGAGLNRGSAISFSVAGKGYVGLGQGNTAPFLSDLWAYDANTKSWTQMADFIGTPRRQAVAFSIDSIGYVGTGQDQNGFTKGFFKYDPSLNIWTSIADFGGTPRKGAAGFAMGGQGYVGTGDDGIYTKDFWQYDPMADNWNQKADFPGNARTGASGWGIFPTAFIACGYDNTLQYTKDVWEYSYFSNNWQQRSDFIGPARTNATAFVIYQTAYLGTGYNGDFLDDFYAYTPILSNENINHSISIHTYPNPAIQFVYFNFKSNIPNDIEVSIFDLSGKKVNTGFDIRNQDIQVDVSHLKKGVYLYSIYSNKKNIVKTGKLIKE